MQAKSKVAILTREAIEQVEALSKKVEDGYVLSAEEANDLRILLICTKLLRNATIVNLHKAGHSQQNIATAFGLTPARVSQLLTEENT